MLLQDQSLETQSVVLLDAQEVVAFVDLHFHVLQNLVDLHLHVIALIEGVDRQLVGGVLQSRREHEDDLSGWNLPHEKALDYAIDIQGAAVHHRIGQGVPNERLHQSAALHEQVSDRGVGRGHAAIHAAVALRDVLGLVGASPRADLEGVQCVVLESGSHDQVVVWQQGTILQDAAALLPIDLHHAAVEDPNPELQHDAAELIVGVRGRASNQGQVLGVVVLEAPGCQEGQRVEEQVRDAEQALQEGQAAIARADDDDPRIHRDLRLTKQLLCHDREGLRP
mmetsp:Transcript_129960/g.417143  ORF Transcript_129960/g.417143 Transcript_129960/m.417143 type:complete len:281 (+) Transcript_129960:1346-2188(+)